MSMTAKVIVKVCDESQEVNPFALVDKIERTINNRLKAIAQSLRVDEKSLGSVMRNNNIRLCDTVIKPSPDYKFLYTVFSEGKDQNRNMQIFIDQIDHEVMPSKSSVLLSIGMWGDYREILSSCACAISSDGTFFYIDDGIDKYLTRDELSTLMSQTA